MTTNLSDREVSISALAHARRLGDSTRAMSVDYSRKAPDEPQGAQELAAVIRAADRLVQILNPASNAPQSRSENQQ